MRIFYILAIILTSTNLDISQTTDLDPFKIHNYPDFQQSYEQKNGDNRIETNTRQIWDQTSSIWKNDSLYTYSYNGEGLLDTLLFQKWNNHWDNEEKHVYNYNNSNRLSERQIHYWWGGWVYYARDNYYYTSNNLTEHDIYLWYGGSTFLPVNRLTYQYNENNQVINYLAEAYDDFYGVWYDAWMIDYNYDSLYRLSETIEYQGNFDWALHNRDLYSYDSLKNNYEDIGQFWQGGTWKNDYLFKYEIDPDSFLTQVTYMDWVSDSLGWKNVWRQIYTYNSPGYLSSVLKEIWVNDIQWQNSRYRIILYDGDNRWLEDITQVWNGTEWVNSYRYLATWLNPVSINNEQVIPEEFRLSQNYPNPFNPQTKIKYAIPNKALVEIRLFDILGTEIETLVNEEKPAGSYEITCNAGNLPSGVYFYQLRAGDFIQTRKMILLK